MRRRLLILTALLAGLAGAAEAQTPAPPAGALAVPSGAPDVMAYIHANQWQQADAAAALWLDPIARKLVTYFRLQAPGAASVTEIDHFMAENPDWPARAMYERRREEALAAESDDTVALAFCARLTLHIASAELRCAEAYEHAGRTAEAGAAARAAWTLGITDPAAEKQFLKKWGGWITPEDQWHRFDHVAWSDPGAAARQLTRLDKEHKQAGTARLALRRDDAKAPALLAALPAGLRHDPSLFLEEARRLRRTNQDQEALALWTGFGAAAQHAEPDHLGAFWAERNLLVRQLLRDANARGAYDLAAAHGQASGEPLLDAEFLAGWIALRRMNDPAAAIPHFQHLAEASQSAITQARAHYWLGRAAEAQNDAARAGEEFTQAARRPTTFYGQLAALSLDDDPAALNRRILALRDPAWDGQRAIDFAGRDLARAAALLVAWGEPRRARLFLLQLEELAPDTVERAMAARLALDFGLPEQAVAIARRAGRDGMILAAGWPVGVDPPAGPVERAVTLGLIRQESSFDTAAASPAGARGLMQLMPATAEDVARKLGEQISQVSLTMDPALNMRLGTAYLQDLLDRFGGSLPLAVAAYNAGPGRVKEWLTANGDPRTGAVDMIDWIELIPIGETRNYVQRVIENVGVYRAREDTALPYPLTTALRD